MEDGSLWDAVLEAEPGPQVTIEDARLDEVLSVFADFVDLKSPTSRAKQRITASGAEFRLPRQGERSERMVAVLEVLYLIFNEGYTASAGVALNRVELTSEAIRLARQLHARVPEDGEVAGLLALMLLTDARRPARTTPDGELVPLAEQERSSWDSEAIAEGVALITETLATARIRPYQLQAAIAAVHDEAPRAEDTDWKQILTLYDLLDSVSPGPMVTLTESSRWPWSTERSPVWKSWKPLTPILHSPATTGSTPSRRTCSISQGTTRELEVTTNEPQQER